MAFFFSFLHKKEVLGDEAGTTFNHPFNFVRFQELNIFII